MSIKITRPQIREVFLRNGAHIEPGHDDLPDYVYESAFELLEMAVVKDSLTAQGVQGRPAAYAVFTDDGNIRIWCADPVQAETLRQQYGGALQPLYTATQPTPGVQGEPVGWHTEDHLDDKSATTYSAEVAQRWRDKGWPVWPLYTAPQLTEQQPAPDVAGLVEALEAALGSFDDWCEGQDPSDIADAIDTFPWVMQARAALAAHRNQGAEV